MPHLRKVEFGRLPNSLRLASQTPGASRSDLGVTLVGDRRRLLAAKLPCN